MPPITVLVVDDYEPFRRFVCSMLEERAEFQVIGQASDGLEAIQKAVELQPDLILMDIGLPKLNGISAAKQIRGLARHSKLIFVSQESDSEVVQETFRLGASGFVHKPRALGVLLSGIQAVLAGNRFISNDVGFNQGTDPQHRHAAHFYSDDTAFLKSTTRFITDSLAVADAVIVLATKSHREGLVQNLRAAGCDIDGATQQGKYISMDAAEMLSAIMVNGVPAPARFSEGLSSLLDSVAKAVNTAHPRVAIFGECVGLLYAAGNLNAAINLEKIGNELIQTHNVDILCAYPWAHGHEDDHAFNSICAEHSVVYAR